MSDEWIQTFSTGSASITLHDRQPTEEELARWAEEDAERDERRIPIGFRAPEDS